MINRIAQISDTHLSPPSRISRANFDRVAEHLTTSAPDLIVNTGDLALDGADHDADLQEAVSAHRSLGVETYVLPGNHDVGDHLMGARKQPVDGRAPRPLPPYRRRRLLVGRYSGLGGCLG